METCDFRDIGKRDVAGDRIKRGEQENFAGVDVKVKIAVSAPFGFERVFSIVISC